MSKSKDLKEAAVTYRLQKQILRETSEVFVVSISAVNSWGKKYQETGDLSNTPLNREFKKIDLEKLKAHVKEHPDNIQQEMAEVFRCCNQAISKALKRCGITQKRQYDIKNNLRKSSRV